MHRFILFLDFDGVLHPHTSGTCRHIPLLEDFLRKHPRVQVVISSTWRFQYSLQELKEWFSEDLWDRIIDVTPEAAAGPGSRQHEIELWLREHPALHWVALDDEAALFRPGCPWLMKTDTRIGLTPQVLAELGTHVATL